MKTAQIIKQPSVAIVEIHGRSLEEIFVLAAKSVGSILEGRQDAENRERKDIDFEESVSVTAVDSVSLMVEWLTQLIGMTDMESVVIDQVTIDSIDEMSLTAVVSGYHTDTFVQPLSGVNYDSVKIEQETDGWKATFTLEF